MKASPWGSYVVCLRVGVVMSESELRLSYKLEKADYWAALNKINRQASWKVVGIAFGVWFLTAFVGSFYLMQDGFKGAPLEMGTIGLFGLLGLMMLVALCMRLLARLQLNRALSGSDAGPLQPSVLEVGADGMSLEDNNTKTMYNWAAFERIEVTDRLVLLYFSPVEAIMIPRHVLGGDDSMTSFVARAREHIMTAQRGN